MGFAGNFSHFPHTSKFSENLKTQRETISPSNHPSKLQKKDRKINFYKNFSKETLEKRKLENSIKCLQKFSLRIFSIFRQRNWLSKELIFFFFEIYWWKNKSFKYFSDFQKNICLSNQSLNCKNNQCLYCYEIFSPNLIPFLLGSFFCCWMDGWLGMFRSMGFLIFPDFPQFHFIL